MKYKNKEKKEKKSGVGATKLRKYIYHDALQFLDKVRFHAETASSSTHEEEHPQNEEETDEPAAPVTPASTPSATTLGQPTKVITNKGKNRKKIGWVWN